MKKCIVLIAVLFCMASSLASEPTVLKLDAGVPVWDVTPGDVNNDKRTDLLVFTCKDTTEPLEKSLQVFLAQEDGRYPEQPSFKVDLPPQAGALFLSETDGVPPVEVAAVDAEGASVYRCDGGKLDLVAQPRFASLFPTWSKEPQFLEKTSVDLDGDGVDEWLVPTALGYAVRKVSGEMVVIPCGVNSSVRGDSSLSVTYKFPACHPFGVEGQGQKALAFLTDERAYFAHGLDWSESTVFKIPLNLGEKWDSTAAMYDIDGNTMPDLVVTQTEGTLNLRILTQVYLASENFGYPAQPTATFDSKGSFTAPILQDVNGDEKLDLVFINIPWGVKFFVNLFMFRRLGVDLDVYLYNNGAFPPQPDFRGHVTIEAPEGRNSLRTRWVISTATAG